MSERVFVDLSHPLSEKTQPYPGDPTFSSSPCLTIDKDGCNVLSLSLGSHTGTHVDAPYHFVPNGLRIDQIPLSTFLGQPVLVDLTHLGPRGEIEPSDLQRTLENLPPTGNPILLLNTGWSAKWGSPEYHDHPFLTGAAADAIVSSGRIKLVGIDAFIPDPTPPAAASGTDGDGHEDQPSFVAHQTLLGAGVVIAENLCELHTLQRELAASASDDQWAVSLIPLAIGGGDGSPVRAFAWRQK